MNSKELFDILHPGMIVSAHGEGGRWLDLVIFKNDFKMLSVLRDCLVGGTYPMYEFLHKDIQGLIMNGYCLGIFDKDGVLLYEFGKKLDSEETS